MTDRQSNWERLQRLWVAGEPLAASEQAERVEAAREPEQQAELQFYERARRWLDQASNEEAADDARFLEHALRLAKNGRSTALRLVGDTKPPVTSPPLRRQQSKSRVAPAIVWWSAGVATAAAVAAAAVAWRPAARGPSSAVISGARAARTDESANCQLASFSGAVELPRATGTGVIGAALQEGDRIATLAGTACLKIDESVRVCLPNDSTVTLTSLSPQDLRIQVLSGGALASLSPRPVGSFFSLTGGGLVATAHGTVYALELTQPRGVPRVTVFEGTVEVKAASEEALVSAGASTQFDPATRTWLRQPVGGTERARWLGGFFPPPVASTETTAADSGAPPRAPTVPSADAADANAGLSRDALFAAARKQTGLGHARAARALYRELLTRYPGPGTAAVQVVLGNLEMELGAPERALTAFESYLHSGGPLEPEALHGKVRALRALGRAADERATIRTYLTRYPGGFQAPTLKQRLQELE